MDNPLKKLSDCLEKAQRRDQIVRMLDGCTISISSQIRSISITPESVCANPAFVMSASEDVLVFCFRHEARHLVKQHFARRVKAMKAIMEDRLLTDEATIRFSGEESFKWILVHFLWNFAADMEVNREIECKELHQEKGVIEGYREFSEFPKGLTAEEAFKVFCNDPKWRETAVQILREKGFIDADYE